MLLQVVRYLAIAFALASTALRAPVASAQAERDGGADRRYGVIEIYGRGITPTIFSINDGIKSGSQNLDLAIVKEYAPVNLSSLGADQLPAVAKAVDDIAKNMAEADGMPAFKIFVVASSGIGADANHWETIKKVLNAKIGAHAGAVSRVTAAEEGILGFQGVVNCERMAHRRGEVLFVDIGSSNTKGAYVASRAPRRCGYEDLETFMLPFGAVSFLDGALNAPAHLRRPDEPAATALHRHRRQAFEPALAAARAKAPGLTEKPRVYLGGGAAWALAAIARPTDQRRYVKVAPGDIARLRQQLAVEPTCITDMEWALRPDPATCAFLDPDLSAIADPAVRAAAEEDFRAVLKAFTAVQLMSAAEILDSLAKTLDFEGRSIYFARPSKHAWQLGFLLDREKALAKATIVPNQ